MALGCCRISFRWRFALFCGGCYIIDFIVNVSCSCFVHIYLIWLHSYYKVFNHIVSLTFQQILSLEISDLQVSLDKFREYNSGELLESSNCSVEMSALVFCSMVLRVEGVLRGCLLPGSAAVGAWWLSYGECKGFVLKSVILGSVSIVRHLI